MSTKVDLEGCYAQHFSQFDQDSSHLSSFFQRTLGVRNWNWKDIVDEIKALTSTDAKDFDKVVILYICLENTCLEHIASSAVSITELR
jgi:hypothetical protein